MQPLFVLKHKEEKFSGIGTELSVEQGFRVTAATLKSRVCGETGTGWKMSVECWGVRSGGQGGEG